MVVLMMSLIRRLVIVLAALAVVASAVHVSAARQSPADAAPRRTIDVVAERFLFVPSEITVDAGTTVEIRLTSEDTDHGFRIIGRDINVLIPKRGRGTATVVFDAAEPGEYAFECSHMCGAGHSFMRGRIKVRPRTPPHTGARR